MNPSIFHISLILDNVTQYLTNLDLFCCTLVSKEWNFWFTPVFWHSPKTSVTQIGQHGLDALFQNQHHVQTLRNPCYTLSVITSQDRLWSFQNLKSFALTLDHSHDIYLVNNGLRWLQGRKGLQKLKISISHHDNQIQQQLLTILQSHPNLHQFDFESSLQLPLHYIQELIQACSRLDTLHFINSVDMTDPIPEKLPITAIETLMNDSPDFNIRELSIEIPNSYETFILIPLLRHCPRLTKLSLGSRFSSDTLSGIVGVFNDGYCPHLKDLSLIAVEISESLSRGAHELVQSLGNGNCDGSDSILSRGLQSISLDKRMELTRQCSFSLMKYHAETLTILYLPSITSIYLVPFIDLMHGLPKLQLVESNLWLRFAPMEGLDTDEMMKKQWNCLGLTHFKADVGSVSTFHDVLGASWKGSRGDLRVGYIFDQIGRLPELTQLELGAQFKQLATLKGQGYLSRLSGLKQLKVWIANYDVLHLDNEEAEWMILNWPRLIHVSIKSKSSKSPFIATLLVKRPYLEINYIQ